MKLFKTLRCKHKNLSCLTNFYGDCINKMSLGSKIYRSAWICKDCEKVIYSEYLCDGCKTVNWDWEYNEEGKLVKKC